MEYTQELAEKLTKAIQAHEVKAVEGEYTMVISEEIPDRDGETVMLSGAQTENYMKSPVVLIDHSYEVESIVGKTTSIEVVGNRMIAKWVWADTEDALLAKQLYDGGFLKTSSIGFIPKQRQENDRSIITIWELLEWSLVAVPCNPNALSQDGKALFMKGIEKGLVKEEIPKTPSELDGIKAELKEIKELLKSLADGKAQGSDMDAQMQEAKAKKELLQSINRATASALENLKKL